MAGEVGTGAVALALAGGGVGGAISVLRRVERWLRPRSAGTEFDYVERVRLETEAEIDAITYQALKDMLEVVQPPFERWLAEKEAT